MTDDPEVTPIDGVTPETPTRESLAALLEQLAMLTRTQEERAKPDLFCAVTGSVVEAEELDGDKMALDVAITVDGWPAVEDEYEHAQLCIGLLSAGILRIYSTLSLDERLPIKRGIRELLIHMGFEDEDAKNVN